MNAVEPVPATFDCWALAYDSEANPLLSLERRVLESLLPPLHRHTVLDAGCGSGRHFELFVEHGASTIHAVDFSPQMLAAAAINPPACVQIHRSSVDAVPLPAAVIDTVVCSLVPGYLPSLASFFREMRRLLRPDSSLFLTDIHPDTALRNGWQRSFLNSGEQHTIAWNQCSLASIREEAHRAGFHIVCDLTFPFASPEREIFVAAGREAAFEQWRNDPALYALVLRPNAVSSSLTVSAARCGMSAHEAPLSSLSMNSGCVTGLNAPPELAHSLNLDLSGYLLLPGLINAHDHLEFGLFPQLAAGIYEDAAHWAADIHQRFVEPIAVHRAIPYGTRIRFGALRNLLCGVTTVCHHNPIASIMLGLDFPVGVVNDFRWAHSSTFDPAGLQHESSLDSPERPFILHAGEGNGQRAQEELQTLQSLGLLRSSTVIVHGLAADSSFLDTCRALGVSFIVCPSSNHRLFDALPAEYLLESYPFVTIGSDSPLTACGDLLDEIRFTTQQYEITSGRVYEMLMMNAPKLLQLGNGQGTLAPGAYADIIAVPDRGSSPAKTLHDLTWRDVHLVLRQGTIQMVSPELHPRVPAGLLRCSTKICVDDQVRWIRGDWHNDFVQAAPIAQNGVVWVGKRRITLA